MLFSRSSSLLAALALATATLVAQTPAGQPPAAQTPAPADPAVQRPTFRTFVDLVTTDVIVRDGTGQFVADLTKEEFDVFEDGVKQEVASVSLVHGGRTFNLQAPPPQPPQEGIILPPARPTNDAAGRIFLFFVDDLHMNFRDTSRIRQLFDKMNKTLLHEGDMFGVVSTGTSSIAIDLTYDRKRMDEAIKKIAGSALKPSELIEGPQGPNGNSELKYRAHVAFSTAYDIVSNLSKVQNRRKAVIYVSNGYDFNPFENSRYGNSRFGGGQFNDPNNPNSQQPYSDPFSPERQGQQFADADLAMELGELTRAANRANATMYTLDARGLVAGPDLDEQVDTQEWGTHIRKTQDSLRMLADLTGGIAMVNQNDFDKVLKRIDSETSDYYVLGYYSKNPDPLRRTRKLEVKVARKDTQVWSRKTYSLRPPPAPSSGK